MTETEPKLVRPATDVIITCPENHPILLRFPKPSLPIVFASSYPWNYQSGIINGTTRIGLINPVTKEGSASLSCPHCGDKPKIEVNLISLRQQLLKANF